MKTTMTFIYGTFALVLPALTPLAAQTQPPASRPDQAESARPKARPSPPEANLEFATRQILDDLYQIACGGDRFYMYVLVGSDKALVVDTQFVAEFDGVKIIDRVRAITSKPLFVVNTHSHGDHTAANNQFGEVHASSVCVKEIKAAAAKAGKDLDYVLTPIEHGDLIDLGDRKVEVIEIPAHSAGSIALLDTKAGYLFTGDEIDSGQVIGLHKGNIGKHMANMNLLYEKYYDRIGCLIPAHNGAPLTKRYIKYFLDLDAAIIAGTAPLVPTADGPNFPFPVNEKMVRYRQNFAAVVYTRP
jgi:hydroxyacylglutathione hydrolase